MINGFNELSKKYKKMFTLEEIVHDVSGGFESYASGLTTSEAFVGLVEHNVGQNVYQKYFKLERTYSELFSITNEYIKEKKEYNKLLTQIKSVVANIKIVEKDILGLEEQRKNLVNKTIISPQEEKEIERITVNLYNKKVELQEEINKKNELEQQRKDREMVCSAYLTRINRLKEKLIKIMEEVNKLENAFGLFKDKDFKENVEQDFIDACLLPGEEKKEPGLRTIAKSKFMMMKLESVYLEKIKDYAKNLTNHLHETTNAKALLDIKLSKEIIAQNKQIEGLKNLSTDFLTSSDAMLNDPVIADYYIYVYNQTIKSELGSQVSNEYANLPEVAMNKFGIPEFYNGSIKSKISAILNKSKTTFSIDSLNGLFCGVDNLIESQKMLKEVVQEYEMDL